ncbi:MAG: phosphoenolpyruvate--protein phosphotransferase [Clostridium sp.]|nr:phosphoenolpyruvate--protein phosphotransferase [Clostridium sp.]
MKKGIAASKGYAIGNAFIKLDTKVEITDKKVDNIDAEKARLEKAIENSKAQLAKIKEKAAKEVGKDKAAVFESHMMLLDDPEFTGAMTGKVESESLNAEKAVSDVIEMYMGIFDKMTDEYMKERGADVKDVGKRVIANLVGNANGGMDNLKENTILIAHDLTPSDTAQLDKDKVIGFLTDIGGRTSHSAIMARTLEIPAIVGLKDITTSAKNGDFIIVDGAEGVALINPDEKTVKEYTEKKKKFEAEREELKKLIDKETVTKAGKRVEVCGNIGKAADVAAILANGGDGVGLFRTEFLYMGRDTMPTEEDQFDAYKEVVTRIGKKKPVVIRTLDIGGDKKLPYLPLPKEMNPFLGFRAIRLCLGRKDIFKVQLRALLRASAFGNLKIMFPMISSLEEFLQAKEVLKECMGELKAEGKEFNENVETGIMVEIPAAAVMADELAKHVDFFSIGTNDLIQYTLAADRMNEKVSYLYNPMHPAVLALIKRTIAAAHKEGKWCGMCGEMAGDEKAIPTLVEYGLDEFSMSASSILSAKKYIMNN